MNALSQSMVPAVVMEGISKSFDGKDVLSEVDLHLAAGEIIALLGPSGCGKTTLLRIVAGLLAPSGGVLQIAGRPVANGSSAVTPPEARGLGMVFQDYALWPHLSVVDNVAFPLRMRGMGRSSRRSRALEALRRVGLDHLAQRSPGTLSGGQQQRVALARAVVAEPPLVLFDEPLSNLDRELRDSLALEIGSLLRELGLSAIFVTHDQSEAFAIADRVAVMLDGRVSQIDAPERLFSSPANVDVARFLNIGAIFDGIVADGRFQAHAGELDLPVSCREGVATLLVPRMAMRMDPAAGKHADINARVERCQFQGDRYLLHLTPVGGAGKLVCPSDCPARVGETVPLTLHHERLRIFPA